MITIMPPLMDEFSEGDLVQIREIFCSRAFCNGIKCRDCVVNSNESLTNWLKEGSNDE